MTNNYAVYDPTRMIATVDGEIMEGFAGEGEVAVTQGKDWVEFNLHVSSKSAAYLIAKLNNKVEVQVKHSIFHSARESRTDYLDIKGSYILDSYIAEFPYPKMATIKFLFLKGE